MGSHDVVEVLRNLVPHVQLSGEKFPEESPNVQGTRLGERDLNRIQPPQGKNQNLLLARIGGLTSPEASD